MATWNASEWESSSEDETNRPSWPGVRFSRIHQPPVARYASLTGG